MYPSRINQYTGTVGLDSTVHYSTVQTWYMSLTLHYLTLHIPPVHCPVSPVDMSPRSIPLLVCYCTYTTIPDLPECLTACTHAHPPYPALPWSPCVRLRFLVYIPYRRYM